MFQFNEVPIVKSIFSYAWSVSYRSITVRTLSYRRRLLFSASLVRSDKTLSTRILFLHDDRNSHTRHLIGLNPNPRTTYVSERIGRPLQKSWWTRPVGHFKLDVRHIIRVLSPDGQKKASRRKRSWHDVRQYFIIERRSSSTHVVREITNTQHCSSESRASTLGLSSRFLISNCEPRGQRVDVGILSWAPWKPWRPVDR